MNAASETRMNILMVDDQSEGLLALEAILGPLNQNLVRATSGKDALRQLLKQDFALILLDVVMPDMDGFETARLIRTRSRNRDTPIIFLTALSRGEIPTSKAYELGAVDYILKPIETEILRSKVAVFVELARKTELIRQQAEALRAAEQREHELQLAEAARKLQEERQRAGEELLRREMELMQQEKQWLEAVLNALPTPLMLLEPETATTIFANHAARLLPPELTTAEPTSQTFTDAAGYVLSADEMPLKRATRGDQLDGFNIRWQDGETHGSFLVSSHELDSMWGHDKTVLLTMLDVTALTEIETRLQAALQARDSFLSVAAHELRTPITTLGLQVQRLLRAQKRGEVTLPSAGGRDPVMMLDRAVKRLTHLISDLLDVSRIKAGKLELRVDDVDLAEVVRDVTSQMREEFATAQCALDLQLDEVVVGRWDRARLEQVVANLATNALKYAPGKPVEISVRQFGESVALRVRDRGIGIAQADQARIFQRFERAVSASEYGGLGLGLWIVRQIVSSMGGDITVQSAEGEGATFEVVLPIGRQLVMAASA